VAFSCLITQSLGEIRLDFGCGGRVGIGPGAKLDFHDWAQVTVAPDQFGITEQQVLAVRVVGVNLDVPCGCLCGSALAIRAVRAGTSDSWIWRRQSKRGEV